MNENDLTVCCLAWGDWCRDKLPVYVRNLYRGVQTHLSLPHRFVLFTDRPKKIFSSRIEVKPMDVPEWRWNLRKMLIYRIANGLRGRVLCFDLDVAITGSLDELASYGGEFATCEAAYHPGKIGGSLIGFEAGTLAEEFWNPMLSDPERYEAETKGSERKYFAMRLAEMEMGLEPDFWQRLFPGQVVSYKVDCDGGVPEDARVVRFHGHPRPHHVEDGWLKDYWHE